MRPKKVILLIDPNEQDLSTRKFLLVTHGYRVLEATNAPAAIALFTSNLVDLVVTDANLSKTVSGDELLRTLRKINKHVPMIVMAGPKFKPQVCVADALLTKTITATEMLERFRIMSARKRGPRKSIAQLVPATA